MGLRAGCITTLNLKPSSANSKSVQDSGYFVGEAELEVNRCRWNRSLTTKLPVHTFVNAEGRFVTLLSDMSVQADFPDKT